MRSLNSLVLLNVGSNAEEIPTMKVYKSPTCGCCQAWVDYMRDNEFTIETVDLPDLSQIKLANGITPELQSCHTAIIEGYVFEGHIPVDYVRRLLKEKPDIVGLSAPGMPAKSPGMGSIEPKDYSVVSFDKDGKIEVYSE